MIQRGQDLGLQQLMNGAWKPFIMPDFDGNTLNVTASILGHENSLWVGTANQGIYRIRDHKVDQFDGDAQTVQITNPNASIAIH
jgi:hypothetical protein